MSKYLSVRPNLAKALADAIAATDEDVIGGTRSARNVANDR